mgnify:CR=1 FL=1
MRLAAIVAHDPNLLIGAEGGLPWHYPEDLKRFKSITMGHTLLMGRIVFEEINEKPLPGRKNVVLSRSKTYPNVPTYTSIEEALSELQNDEWVFVIGGAQIYKQLLPQCELLYVTLIHQEFEGDTYFPEYRGQNGTVWEEINREEHPEMTFIDYRRLR